MNRGVLQSSPVQQFMAAGNPNWFPITATRPPSHHLPNSPYSHPLPTHHNNFNYLPPQTHHSSFPFSSPSWTLNDSTTNQDHITQDSWSHQLLMNGLVGDEEREAMEQLVKQENNTNCGLMYANNEDFQQGKPTNNHCFSPHSNKFIAPTSTNSSSTTATTTSSPQSCITNLFEFSSSPAPAKPDLQLPVPVIPDPSSEGGAVKKAKVQTSATQSTFKVRKFGDRITSLHQLVSPFGKTDTASVLLEAIGYIRFLHSQIEALSIPYLSNGSGNNKRQQQQHPHSAQGERNCIFPEDGGQLLNDNCLKRKRGPDQEEPLRDLRSIGLCLVPVSCISNVGRETGADYWAPALGGFR